MKKQEYYFRLKRAIEYVENNLYQKIDLKELSQYAFSSLSHFHRIFYYVTGFSLKEYIRNRRLYNAAIKLIRTQDSIINIAHESQFETPESFTKSFKKYYHLSPREFRKQQPEIKMVNMYDLNINENILPEDIVFDYVYYPKSIMVGYKIYTTLEDNQQTKDIPNLFAKIKKENLFKDIPDSLAHRGIVGVYSEIDDIERFYFILGLFVNKPPKNNSTWEICELNMGEYARFTFLGPRSRLVEAWQYIYGQWLLTSERNRREGLDFEIYYPNKTDIYIPIKK